ncbi:MAG: alanine--tRNA ligase [Methanobacteriota archaeon]
MTDASEYDLEFFHAGGFQRRRCPKCGKQFWTQGGLETCNESPCEPYQFLGKSPFAKALDIHQMREAYLSYFERNGHTRIARYPITARWRDDVFFTQASIYDFQPWVLNGTIKPPANPLTISQTCARFNDIDNVGRTGSHFTMFEMIAHHAFNTPEEQIYFKDRTVELCHGLLRELGVGPEHITYIEADWVGGGNSGPCFEVIVDGVELATLVFMQYAETDKGKVPLPMKVVDTGYGLERFTWMSQGSSSAYEACFGPTLARVKKETGFVGDKDILSEFSKVSGMLNIDTAADLRTIRQKVADRLGIPLDKLLVETTPMENIYIACDHSRALMFLLNDGVMPSNVKAGYFARMLVRRALRSISALKLSLPLADIVAEHIAYYAPHFPELAENRDGILRIVSVEEEKYRETLSKGKALVGQIESRLGGKPFDLETLVDLYDTHGLNPEIVREFTKSQVTIPDDFYKRVAERHIKPEKEAAAGEETRIDAPPTELLFYQDPYKKTFMANVLTVFGNAVVLDKTYFYPEGGGQISDLGDISGVPVTHVRKVGTVVVHELAKASSKLVVGAKVRCKIDWPRRRQLMRHHTAAHIVNAAARQVLGNHVWQAGAHKDLESGRLDITHYQSITRDEVLKIEEVANRIVLDDIEIDSHFMIRSEAEGKHGFRLYQGGAVPGRDIRVVNILGEDVEACAGTHCERTGEVGLIKLIGVKRIQDGVVRIEFVAGKTAYDHVRKGEKALSDAADELGVRPNEVHASVKRMGEELKALRKGQIKAERVGAKEIAAKLAASAKDGFVFKALEQPRTLAQEVSKELSLDKAVKFAAVASGDDAPTIFVSSSDKALSAGELGKAAAAPLGMKGGGRPDFAQFVCGSREQADKFMDALRAQVK